MLIHLFYHNKLDKWGLCPQTPGIFRFLFLQRVFKKQNGSEIVHPHSALLQKPEQALRLLPSIAQCCQVKPMIIGTFFYI
ncbi:MAG: hypothetical protein CVU88_06775 [Firmicutes bacterium HGW-Firmicutes-13]|nr:MAG: hypothetical protein CVU88_06775 [Firmicutes bacterium HGW-Firmicutes-13]